VGSENLNLKGMKVAWDIGRAIVAGGLDGGGFGCDGSVEEYAALMSDGAERYKSKRHSPALTDYADTASSIASATQS
jgi:hypothetical protein